MNFSFLLFLLLSLFAWQASAANDGDARKLFSQPRAGLSSAESMDFNLGRSFFKRIWVSAPTSTLAADGLGPLYNARSCTGCHVNNGRSKDVLLRLSIPAQSDAQRQALKAQRVSLIPEPTYGVQLQNIAIQGLRHEGAVQITYDELKVTLSDGDEVTLRKPSYYITDLGYGPLHPQTMISPRIAPPVIGLGLLAQISEQEILRHADSEDRDGDGISGKPNSVWSNEHQRVMLGRFGWKAGVPTLNEQTQMAFFNDIGISTPLHPQGAGECTEKQIACLALPNGNSPQYENVEAHSDVVRLVNFYVANLAPPPARHQHDANVMAGRKIFEQSGCASCHVGSYTVENKVFSPYTDLLLHDMGEGLADDRPEGEADGREWRTAPLWGIGLTERVNGNANYLHDGRARSVLEAILWHGGEAQKARDAVVALPRAQREALLSFIESL